MEVSAHLLVDRRGGCTQFVPFDLRAWHAGVSSWQGRPGCNDYSIGIELEGARRRSRLQQRPVPESWRAVIRALCGLAYPTPGTADALAGHCGDRAGAQDGSGSGLRLGASSRGTLADGGRSTVGAACPVVCSCMLALLGPCTPPPPGVEPSGGCAGSRACEIPGRARSASRRWPRIWRRPCYAVWSLGRPGRRRRGPLPTIRPTLRSKCPGSAMPSHLSLESAGRAAGPQLIPRMGYGSGRRRALGPAGAHSAVPVWISGAG
ncbi:MAG: N-acetylmuramoyl-L-alanine amidase [Gammaproteobacteria bacterium]|nr:N-acetylmuramoyl-L-alanine amidase [Gammaproteobacteria bacterium]